MTQATFGRLVVYRPESYMDNAFPFVVRANGEQLGDVASGATAEFELPAGAYDLEIRQAWWSGRKRAVTIRAGERTTIACPHRMRGLRLPANVFLMILFPWLYLKLEVIKG